jgi:hypothetical protein
MKRSRSPRPSWPPAEALAVLLLVVGTVVAFAGVLDNGFIDDFDDDEYVTNNQHVLGGPTMDNIVWAFTAFHSHNWHPLTWISLQLDAACFGPRPWGFHFTNLLLHIASTLLLFAALRRMTHAVWRSALLAGLFAVHPLHVESVAWVSERKDVLSALFWFLTLLVYAGYAQQPSTARYAAVVACVALGLMAKPMFVTLPFVLLLLDFWPLGRLGKAPHAPPPQHATSPARASVGFLVAEKLPLLLLAAGCAVLTVAAQEHIVQDTTEFSLPERLGNAVVSAVAYLWQALYPASLGLFYPHPHHSLPWWQIGGAALLLVSISAAVLIQMKPRPYLLVGWLWYLGTLIPVIGLVQVGLQARADRYTYLPLVGIFIAAVWGLAETADRVRVRKTVVGVATACLLLVCVGLTYTQVGYWRESPTLWRHTLKVTEGNFLAHFKIGMHCLENRDLAEAERHLQAASDLRPQMASPLGGLARVRKYQRRPDEAIALLHQALEKDPTLAAAHRDLADLLLVKGDWQQAIIHLSAAIQAQPSDTPAQLRLVVALMQLGRVDDARACCEAALARLDQSGVDAPRLRRDLQQLLSQLRGPAPAPPGGSSRSR